MNNQETYTIDLVRLVKALWKRILVIILAIILGALLAFAYTLFFITPMYEATTRMYVNNSTLSVGSVSISSSDLSASQSLVDTYIVIMTSRITLNEVIEQSGVNYTYEQLKKMVSASAVNSTEIFEISVTSPDPEEAALLANTITEVLPDMIASIIDGSSARVVDSAVAPTAPVSPSITKNTAIGAVLGLVISCIVIIVLELMTDRIAGEDDLHQITSLPVLAVIPDLVVSKSGGYGYGYGYGYGEQPPAKNSEEEKSNHKGDKNHEQ